jgi:multimeric flavodoxin WrbA
MKILSILATPHGKKGNTARLLDIVLAAAEGQGAETDVVVLPGLTVLPCLGCDTCHKKGRCPQKDDFESIKAQILLADGVILASPNYIFSVSAQLKAFMDRCCGIIHCLGFEGKYGGSVVTSGGGDEEPIARYMNHFLMTTGIVPVGSVWATMATTTSRSFSPEIEQRASGLGNILVQSWRKRSVPPEIEVSMRRFKERMRKLMLYRKGQWPYEYDYWKKYRDLG